MKEFLDDTFKIFNKKWTEYEEEIDSAKAEFERGIEDLIKIFGHDLARKPTSLQFNRAIFDALIYFQSDPEVRKALREKRALVKKAYVNLFSPESAFSKAIESDTAGAPNTSARLRIWADVISKIAGRKFAAPAIPVASVE
jgi:hypothetical protein